MAAATQRRQSKRAYEGCFSRSKAWRQLSAIRKFEQMSFDQKNIKAQAQKFSQGRFESEFVAVVQRAVGHKCTRHQLFQNKRVSTLTA
jgi:hypothetical protein